MRSLSTRQKDIIRILVQMNGEPVTVAGISEKLGVSSRTILREMPHIEKWMEENDFRFVRKTGVGLRIDENVEHLTLINELIEIENTTSELSKGERQKRILGELLFLKEPIKALALTSKYDISEGTLFGDLDYITEWLKDFGVDLIRRPGMGITVEGSEANIRKAIINGVFNFYDLDQVASLLSISTKRDKSQSSHTLLQFLDPSITKLAGEIIDECGERLNVKYTDSGRIGLHVRIALNIYRILTGKTIDKIPLEYGVAGEKEKHAAKKAAKNIASFIKEDIPEEEIKGLALFLSSAKIWSDAPFFDNPVKAMNIRQDVMTLVEIVEQITGFKFSGDEILIDDLVSHITIMMDRGAALSENIQINPVRQSYPEIYSAVETACQILSERVFSKDLMSGDAGFIAMHFAAAAERIQEYEQKIAIAVVSPFGIGGSRMLASGLTKAFHNIEIRKTISAFEIDGDKLKSEGIDLIVSTTELNTDFPYICVGNVLQIQDRMKLQNRIEAINHDRVLQKTGRNQSDAVSIGMPEIRQTSIISKEIVEIIDNFKIEIIDSVRDMSELQWVAAKVFTDSKEDTNRLVLGFKKREVLGNTYIEELGIALYHCRTNVLSHSRFGFVGLREPLQINEGKVKGAVVMTAPAGVSDDCCLEPIGRISALLIEDKGFLKALIGGDTTAGVNLAEKALVKYFQNLIKKEKGGTL